MASGFIGAKLGLPYAEPLTFLFSRMFGAVLVGALIGMVFCVIGVFLVNWQTAARYSRAG
jgi:hypothetical protein